MSSLSRSVSLLVAVATPAAALLPLQTPSASGQRAVRANVKAKPSNTCYVTCCKVLYLQVSEDRTLTNTSIPLIPYSLLMNPLQQINALKMC